MWKSQCPQFLVCFYNQDCPRLTQCSHNFERGMPPEDCPEQLQSTEAFVFDLLAARLDTTILLDTTKLTL